MPKKIIDCRLHRIVCVERDRCDCYITMRKYPEDPRTNYDIIFDPDQLEELATKFAQLIQDLDVEMNEKLNRILAQGPDPDVVSQAELEHYYTTYSE